MIEGKVGSFPLDDDPTGGEEYRKIATVWAKKMDREFVVNTEEGSMKGLPGDYLCQGPRGEAWPVRENLFEETYRPVDD